MNISQVFHQETDLRLGISRTHQAVKAVYHQKGCFRAGLMVGTLSVSSIVGLALSFFCLEGSVRSIMDVVEDQRSITRLRYFGDFGGWVSLALFSTLAVKGIFDRLIAEGEYIRFQEIASQNDLGYQDIHQILDTLQARCLFAKSLASRKVIALKLCQEPHPLDRQLEGVFQEIKSEINEKTAPRKLFHRMCSAKPKGCSNLMTARIFGVVFPIILVLNFMFSLVGEVGLGKELFVDREELTDVGHFGEWPINAVEAMVTAILLISWYSVNEGDLIITKKIYKRQIDLLEGQENVQARLRKIAHQELAQISKTCDTLLLPDDYK